VEDFRKFFLRSAPFAVPNFITGPDAPTEIKLETVRPAYAVLNQFHHGSVKCVRACVGVSVFLSCLLCCCCVGVVHSMRYAHTRTRARTHMHAHTFTPHTHTHTHRSYPSVTTITAESKQLQEAQELFELFQSDYIMLQRCSEELLHLKALWDMGELVGA